MNPDELRRLPTSRIVQALDELDIGTGWIVADQLRSAPAAEPGSESRLGSIPAAESANQAFQNLIVGRIAERVFREQHLAPLEKLGFEILDLHETGENRDYVVEREGTQLPINVKVASTLFRKARETVGLDPTDCIPISAYKAIGASERVPDLIYVDLVDFALREKVDHFMSGLVGGPSIVWHLLSWYRGTGARKAQDQYVKRLFDLHGDSLQLLVPDASHYRVISAQRVLAIMRENPRRCPGLGVPGAGTGAFVAEVNIHVSVSAETVAWSDVAQALILNGPQGILTKIRRREMREAPSPQL